MPPEQVLGLNKLNRLSRSNKKMSNIIWILGSEATKLKNCAMTLLIGSHTFGHKRTEQWFWVGWNAPRPFLSFWGTLCPGSLHQGSSSEWPWVSPPQAWWASAGEAFEPLPSHPYSPPSPGGMPPSLPSGSKKRGRSEWRRRGMDGSRWERDEALYCFSHFAEMNLKDPDHLYLAPLKNTFP